MATTPHELTPDAVQNERARRVSFDEYLAWGGEENVEWQNGEIISMAPASMQHEDLFLFLTHLMRAYVRKHDLGKVLGSRFVMKLNAQRRGREPDIMFVSKERLHLLKKNYLDGAADAVVEIVSPESVGRDRGEKFVEYEAAGVREYWLIDPERRQAEFYRLGEDGRYRFVAVDDVFRSEVIE